MKQSRRHLTVSILVGLIFAAVVITIAAPKTKIHAQNHLRISLTTDWSHRHMIYTAPDSITTAWRLQGESRYQQQWFRRYGVGGQPGVVAADQNLGERTDVVGPDRDLGELREGNGRELRPDWGQSLPALPAAGSTAPGEEVFPAKYSFNINAAPSCTSDFVVYPTGATGSTTAIAASATGFFSTTAAKNSTITITNGANTLTMTAVDGVVNGAGTFGRGTSAVNSATDLAAAINIAGNGSSVGVSATAPVGGTTVTITATTAGSAGNSIALASSMGPKSNFTWNALMATDLEGGANGTASIMALNNLYAGTGGSCTSGPTTYWAYNTGGTVVTSPVLSPDGTQVAFIQSVGGVANLVVLKWSPPSTFATLTSDPKFPNCTTVPCMISIPFHNGASDTMSSPYYVYGQEVLYVGDDSGVLHKFSNVFNPGITPAEVTSSWPITVHSGVELTGPVFESTSGNIFVADAGGTVSYVRETTSSSTIGGACAGVGSAPCLGKTQVALGGTIVDPPIVDGTNETLFVFDGGGSTDILWQGDTALNQLASVTLTGSAGNTEMRAGDFDNNYFIGAKGSGAGKLYFCGVTSAANDLGLFRVSFTGTSHVAWGTINVMDGAVDGPSGGGVGSSLQLVSANKIETSPLTSVFNTASNTDWLFLSVGNSATTPAACSSVGQGCIMSFTLSETGRWPPANATNGVALQTGPTYASGSFAGDTASATGPMVIDNVAAATGVGNEQFSNIYFLWLTNASNTLNGASASTYGMCNGIVASGGCGVKLTQANLQ